MQQKYSASKDFLSKTCSARNIQPIGLSKKYSASKDFAERNIQPVRIVQQEIFIPLLDEIMAQRRNIGRQGVVRAPFYAAVHVQGHRLHEERRKRRNEGKKERRKESRQDRCPRKQGKKDEKRKEERKTKPRGLFDVGIGGIMASTTMMWEIMTSL